MKKIAAALLLSSAIAAPAFAADSGFYAGVTLGQANSNTPIPATPMSKTKDTVYGGVVGYQFTQNWGVEGFFTGAGKWATLYTPAASASGKADAYGVVATGTLPLSDTFSLYGKLGFASTKTTGTATAAPVTVNIGGTRTAATYGLGLQYNVTPAIGIRAGWDRYSAKLVFPAATFNYNVNAYTVGAVFKF